MKLALFMVGCLVVAGVAVTRILSIAPFGGVAIASVTGDGPASPALPAAPERAAFCSIRELRLTEQYLADGVDGRRGRLLVTNTGRRECSVQGFPKIESTRAGQVTARSRAVDVPAGSQGSPVLLAPGRSASAAFVYTVTGRPDCPRYDRLTVTLPHAEATLPLGEAGPRLRTGSWACGYRVQPFVDGLNAAWRPD